MSNMITGTVKFSTKPKVLASSSKKTARTFSFTSAPFKVTVSVPLAEGQRVQFSVTQGQKGPQAENVTAL